MTPSDVKIVAENINDFIEVPDGINRLRKAVLTLAVSGNFSVAGQSSWISERLGEVCSVKKGKKPELHEEEGKEMLPYLEAKFIRGSRSPKFAKVSDKNSVVVVEDDLIIICDGSNSGEFFTGVNGVLASTMGVITYDKKVLLKEYLEIFLQSNFDLLNKTKKGAAIPHLDFNLFNSLKLDIPTLEEQSAIVGKVQTVMKQLDELESQKNERDLVRSRLTRSAMQALGTADSKIVFDKCTELVKTQEDVKGLENAILNLGISGRLIKPSNGSVDELYENIRNERRLLESDSSTRKKKITTLEPVADGEIPFEIPSSWKWVRLGEIFLIERGGSPRPIESYVTEDPQGLNWIKIGDTEKGGKYISSTKERIIKEGLKKTRQVHSGDLLLTNSMSFGRPYILKIDGCIHDGWLVLHPYHDDLVRDFYYYALSSPVFFQQFLNLVSGAVVKNLNAEKVRSVLIPLPPIAEQKQIVEKIEELMKMVNELKTIISN